MDVTGRGYSSATMENEEEIMDLRRGPWTMEEDLTLIHFIAILGEGRWNSLARSSGLKRTGKSCRLRWLNYLRPDVRRGNITLEEQLLILELHSRWGNRWSKIAQHLPGRTDNEIKNYWRTRVQKQAKQLKCDVNSKQFKDTMRYLWMPRLVERIAAAAADSNSTVATANVSTNYLNFNQDSKSKNGFDLQSGNNSSMVLSTMAMSNEYGGSHVTQSFTPENSSTAASSDSFGTHVVSPISDISDYYSVLPVVNNNNSSRQDCNQTTNQASYSDSLPSPYGFFSHGLEFQTEEVEQIQQVGPWFQSEDTLSQNLWNGDDVLFLQQQLHGSVSDQIW